MIEDRYPIMLVNGAQLSDTVWAMMHEQGTTDVGSFLEEVDAGYEKRVKGALAEEILFEI